MRGLFVLLILFSQWTWAQEEGESSQEALMEYLSLTYFRGENSLPSGSEQENLRVDATMELSAKSQRWARGELQKITVRKNFVIIRTGEEEQDRTMMEFARALAGESDSLFFIDGSSEIESRTRPIAPKMYSYKQSKAYKMLRYGTTGLSIITSGALGAWVVMGNGADMIQTTLVALSAAAVYGNLQFFRDATFKFTTRQGLSGFKVPNTYLAPESSTIENFGKQLSIQIFSTGILAAVQAGLGLMDGGFSLVRVLEVALKNNAARFSYNRGISLLAKQLYEQGRTAQSIESKRLGLSLLVQLGFQFATFADILGFEHSNYIWSGLAASGVVVYYSMKGKILREIAKATLDLTRQLLDNAAIGVKITAHNMMQKLRCNAVIRRARPAH